MLKNPSNLYAGGAVTFNDMPHQQFMANLLAKQQAKMDAMDQYEKSKISSVNDKGLRDIDRATFDNNILDLQRYYQQNKGRIVRGNSQEAFEYEKKYRDLRDFVAHSQDLNARHEAALKFYNERLKQDQRLPDDFMIDLHFNDLPIGAKDTHPVTGQQQSTTPFDITKWSSTPPPFSGEKFVNDFNDIKRVPGSITYEPTPNKFKLNEVTTETFDAAAKKAIAARAADKYDNSYSFSNQVKNEIKDPIRRQQLSDLFKKEYGMDAKVPQDYAISYAMELLQPSLKKSKTVNNDEALIREKAKYRVGRAGGGPLTINDVYDKINILATSSKNEGKAYLQANLLPADAQQVLIDYAKKVTGNNELGNDDVKIIKDEDGKIGVFHAKGSRANQLIGYLNSTNVNLKSQPSVKEKREVISQGNKPTTYLIKGKKYSEKELVDMGYSLDQIKPYKQ